MSNKIMTLDELMGELCDGHDMTGVLVSDAVEQDVLGKELEDWDGNVVQLDNQGYVVDSRMWGCGP